MSTFFFVFPSPLTPFLFFFFLMIRRPPRSTLFPYTTLFRSPGLHPLAKHFRATRDVAVRLGGESLTLSAGQRIDMNHSYKYDADTFLRILADAGLAVRWRGSKIGRAHV